MFLMSTYSLFDIYAIFFVQTEAMNLESKMRLEERVAASNHNMLSLQLGYDILFSLEVSDSLQSSTLW